MKRIQFYKQNIRKLLIGKIRIFPIWIIAAIGIFSFDVVRAMEDDPFSETDKHISIKPMEDKQLEESIKLHDPKFVTPSRWQSVEVLQPSKPWQAWKKEQLFWNNVGKPEYMAEECVDGKRRFVDKWIIPSSMLNLFMSSVVTFREDKTEVMDRQDAYRIMRYENDEITKLRKELYELEISYLDYYTATYDGKTFDKRDKEKDATHPEIFELWKEADAKMKKKEEKEKKERSRIETEISVRRMYAEKARIEEEERKIRSKEQEKYYIDTYSIKSNDTLNVVLKKKQSRPPGYYNDDHTPFN